MSFVVKQWTNKKWLLLPAHHFLSVLLWAWRRCGTCCTLGFLPLLNVRLEGLHDCQRLLPLHYLVGDLRENRQMSRSVATSMHQVQKLLLSVAYPTFWIMHRMYAYTRRHTCTQRHTHTHTHTHTLSLSLSLSPSLFQPCHASSGINVL